jgi:molybdopterin-guanine dinucleotide biosynthesis protein A
MLAPATRDAPVFGLVLCGGESQRMGRDKALLALGGRSLLERAIGELEPLCEEVWLASGPAPRYVELGRLELLDRRPRGSGPLAALEAGLCALRARCERGWLLLLACDMPGAGTALFRELLLRAEREGLDLVGLSGERGPEPLACACSGDLLESVRAALDAGERKMTSHERFPARHGAPPRCAWQARREPELFRNLNTPADLEAARG